MSKKSKPLYEGEWVKVRNLMNKTFPARDACAVCLTCKCAPVWFNIKTKEVRCLKCFTPEGY